MLWLTGWTLGGGKAPFAAPEPFIAVWLVFWAVGGVFTAGTILRQFAGCEVIRADSGQLVHGWRLLGFSRERAYPRIHDTTPFAFNSAPDGAAPS